VVIGGIALVVMKLITHAPGEWALRIHKDGELEGIDIVEHGTPAYHVEFGMGMTYVTPTGAGRSAGLPPVDEPSTSAL